MRPRVIASRKPARPGQAPARPRVTERQLAAHIAWERRAAGLVGRLMALFFFRRFSFSRKKFGITGLPRKPSNHRADQQGGPSLRAGRRRVRKGSGCCRRASRWTGINGPYQASEARRGRIVAGRDGRWTKRTTTRSSSALDMGQEKNHAAVERCGGPRVPKRARTRPRRKRGSGLNVGPHRARVRPARRVRSA